MPQYCVIEGNEEEIRDGIVQREALFPRKDDDNGGWEVPNT